MPLSIKVLFRLWIIPYLKVLKDLIYTPSIEVLGYSSDLVAISSASTIEITGNFMDYIASYTFVGNTTAGGTVTLISQTFSKLVLEITTDSTVQDYTLTLLDGENNSFTHIIDAQNITVYIPDTAANGATGLELWTIPTGTNNDIVVGPGTAEMENNTGDGWNEYAYFGGAFNATSQLIVEFTVNRLNDASNAYGHVRMNDSNNNSRTTNPRVYISAGSTTQIFGNIGGNITTSSNVNDVYRFVYTATTMETFKNGVSIQSHTGTYFINTMYFTFVGFRVLKLINIKVITD